MKIAIAIEEDAVTATGDHQLMVQIRIGDTEMYVAGRGPDRASAEHEAERSLAAAIRDLEQLNEIRRRTGGIRWGALEPVEPAP